MNFNRYFISDPWAGHGYRDWKEISEPEYVAELKAQREGVRLAVMVAVDIRARQGAD